jgi:hypothetical protein
MTSSDAPQQPSPDSALRRLDRLVGTWVLKGNLVGSDEETIVGEITFQWLEGGFFLQQDAKIDFAGMFEVRARELSATTLKPRASRRTSTRTSRRSRFRTSGIFGTTR